MDNTNPPCLSLVYSNPAKRIEFSISAAPQFATLAFATIMAALGEPTTPLAVAAETSPAEPVADAPKRRGRPPAAAKEPAVEPEPTKPGPKVEPAKPAAKPAADQSALQAAMKETLKAIGVEGTKAVLDKFKIGKLSALPEEKFQAFMEALAEARMVLG